MTDPSSSAERRIGAGTARTHNLGGRPARTAGRYRLLSVFAAAILAVWAGASPASAHNTLTSTNPADQETVQSAPPAVVLTFGEPVTATGARVVVTGPSGQVQQGQPRLADNTITEDLQPGAPAGTYTVAWRVTSADGQPVSGAFSFTATAAAAQPPSTPQTSPSATPAPTQQARMPGWLKLIIGAVAILFGVTVARQAGRRGNDGG